MLFTFVNATRVEVEQLLHFTASSALQWYATLGVAVDV